MISIKFACPATHECVVSATLFPKVEFFTRQALVPRVVESDHDFRQKFWDIVNVLEFGRQEAVAFDVQVEVYKETVEPALLGRVVPSAKDAGTGKVPGYFVDHDQSVDDRVL